MQTKINGLEFVRFTVAGAAQVKSLSLASANSLLLPVELRCVNHTASTNSQYSTLRLASQPYNGMCMPNTTQIDQITERVERLLLRYEELQRTNALLAEEVSALTQERDSLRSRLGAARSRVDALLERLPENASHSQSSPLETSRSAG